MSDRLPTGLLVAALLRRVNDDGGLGVVRARGDAQAGAVLVIDTGAGGVGSGAGGARILERGLGLDGKAQLVESLPPGGDAESYWRRRRERDPDLWVVELTTPAAERFAAETMLGD